MTLVKIFLYAGWSLVQHIPVGVDWLVLADHTARSGFGEVAISAWHRKIALELYAGIAGSTLIIRSGSLFSLLCFFIVNLITEPDSVVIG